MTTIRSSTLMVILAIASFSLLAISAVSLEIYMVKASVIIKPATTAVDSANLVFNLTFGNGSTASINETVSTQTANDLVLAINAIINRQGDRENIEEYLLAGEVPPLTEEVTEEEESSDGGGSGGSDDDGGSEESGSNGNDSKSCRIDPITAQEVCYDPNAPIEQLQNGPGLNSPPVFAAPGSEAKANPSSNDGGTDDTTEGTESSGDSDSSPSSEEPSSSDNNDSGEGEGDHE